MDYTAILGVPIPPVSTFIRRGKQIGHAGQYMYIIRIHPCVEEHFSSSPEDKLLIE